MQPTSLAYSHTPYVLRSLGVLG